MRPVDEFVVWWIIGYGSAALVHLAFDWWRNRKRGSE